ncbi:MAG: DUF2147 domain-containing protein [Alphaproteobacteria bacterium]|nr:DUF2147 domain-containing protein [Alphaproteobacteria bacterium]
MKFKLLSMLTLFALPMAATATTPFVGFYQTIDDEINAPKSIVALYEYKDGDDIELAGRIVALYNTDGTISETLSNPQRIADKVAGSPKMVGLDIIWNMEWDDEDKKYEDGKIMDPKSGKIYSSVMWQDNPETLNVRGKIGPFGRTQKWNVLKQTDLPSDLQNIDATEWKPNITK